MKTLIMDYLIYLSYLPIKSDRLKRLVLILDNSRELNYTFG